MDIGDGFDVRSLAVSYGDGFTVREHSHPWGQLVYATSGVMRVTTGDTMWFVPSTRAVWLPPEVAHTIVMQGAVRMRTLYLAPGRSFDLEKEITAIEVSPMLRELILHILTIGMLDPNIVSHKRLAGVLIDLVAESHEGDLQLPLPTDPRASAAAQWLQANPSDRKDLQFIAKQVGSSLRTLQRLFSSFPVTSFLILH